MRYEKKYNLIVLIIIAIAFTSIFAAVSRGTSTITTETPTTDQSSDTHPQLRRAHPQTGVPYILSGTTYNTETVDTITFMFLLKTLGKAGQVML